MGNLRDFRCNANSNGKPEEIRSPQSFLGDFLFLFHIAIE